jgi:hypothetical protein
MLIFGRTTLLIILGLVLIIFSTTFYHNGLRSQCAFCISKISADKALYLIAYGLFIEVRKLLVPNNDQLENLPVNINKSRPTRAPPVIHLS